MQSHAVRRLNEVLLGIDARRIPPAFARRLRRDLARSPGARPSSAPGAGRKVLFFPDTFVNYYEPLVGEQAISLLQAAGSEVTLGEPGLRCCGRPLISNGLLDEAVANARHNVEGLHERARAGWAIVACEPSCLLTIKDDYPALLRGEERTRAETVAAACVTLEECLESLLASAVDPRDPGTTREGDAAGATPHPDPSPQGGREHHSPSVPPGDGQGEGCSEDGRRSLAQPSRQVLRFRAGPRRILVQGHCHQRSLVGMGPLVRLLGRIPGAEVIDLDAGCCGLAGSFGYECEHYEVSRLVGEQRLFPALRQAGPEPEVVIVAPGFSCRLQIAHFTGRTAIAPATLLHRLIASTPPSPLS
jgi:Fe-S oxidoreductase